eukprot:3244714-Prymnesium_polylepis.1
MPYIAHTLGHRIGILDRIVWAAAPPAGDCNIACARARVESCASVTESPGATCHPHPPVLE